MANRTDSQATTVHGTNPQYLVDRIIRNKIYNDAYWKEFCFALTTESLIDRAAEIDYVGGTYGGRRRPAKFLCLFLKLLQIQPDEDVILEYIKQPELKYLRALGAAYYRISQKHISVYKTLEPLYADYRKLRFRDLTGKMTLIHMDEFIDWLFREKTVCDVTMPGLPKREILEATLELPPRPSVLEDDLEDIDDLEGAVGEQKADAPPQVSALATSASAAKMGGSASPTRAASRSPTQRSPVAPQDTKRPPSKGRAPRSRSLSRRRKERAQSKSAERSRSPRRREEAKGEAKKDKKEKREKAEKAERAAFLDKVERAPRSEEKLMKPDKSEKKEKKKEKDKKERKDEKVPAKKEKKDKDGLSVEEWNQIRKEMGLKPLRA